MVMVIDVLERDDLPFPRSLSEVQRRFPDEAACAAYLERARWGDGFVCGHCGTPREPCRFANRPGVCRCRHCNRDTRLTAGTVMGHTPSDNRHGLVANAMVTTADGFAEREAAKTMIDDARPAADNPQADTSRARWEKVVRRRREGREMRGNGAQKVENEPKERGSSMM